jgi:hypothetical protein
MKNLFHQDLMKDGALVFFAPETPDYENNMVPAVPEVRGQQELTAQEVDTIIDGVVNQLGRLGTGKADLIQGVIISKMEELDLPIDDFLDQLEGSLNQALNEDASKNDLNNIFHVELGVTEIGHEREFFSESNFVNTGSVEYQESFRDDVYDLLKNNPEYYLDGDGNVVVNEKITKLEDYFPEGTELPDWSGKERIKRDLKNLHVSSGEELWEMIQWGMQNPEKGTGITGQDFTKEDANKLFQYKQNGFLEGNPGDYALDRDAATGEFKLNAQGEMYSSEVMECQALIAKANAALEAIQEGNSVEPKGVDGQDGTATVDARRHLVTMSNELKDRQPKTEIVRTRNIDVKAKALGIPELVQPGKKLILEDVSGSMKEDIKFTHAHLEQALLQNPAGVEIKIGRVEMERNKGAQDQEAGFNTAARMIPNNFDPKVQGNEVIIYTDERQQDTGLNDLVDVAAEYNVKLTIYYFHPGRKVEGPDRIRDDFKASAGKFKKVSFDLSNDNPAFKREVKDQLKNYTKRKYSHIDKKKMIQEQIFYDEIDSPESQIDNNFEVNKEFEEVLKSLEKIQRTGRAATVAENLKIILNYFQETGGSPEMLLKPVLGHLYRMRLQLENQKYKNEEAISVFDMSLESAMRVTFNQEAMAYVPQDNTKKKPYASL